MPSSATPRTYRCSSIGKSAYEIAPTMYEGKEPCRKRAAMRGRDRPPLSSVLADEICVLRPGASGYERKGW